LNEAGLDGRFIFVPPQYHFYVLGRSYLGIPYLAEVQQFSEGEDVSNARNDLVEGGTAAQLVVRETPCSLRTPEVYFLLRVCCIVSLSLFQNRLPQKRLHQQPMINLLIVVGLEALVIAWTSSCCIVPPPLFGTGIIVHFPS
jgi:hypothetical protein